VTAFLAMSCTALKYAGDVWITVLSAGLMILFMAATVAAVLDRGRRQALAAGFAICVAIYGVLFWSAPHDASNIPRELDPYTGWLPTSKLMKPFFEMIVKRTWIDLATGKEVATPTSGAGYGGIAGAGFGGGGIGGRENPPREKFMVIAHVLWAAVLGYSGSRLAAAIYCRRSATEKWPASGPQAGPADSQRY